MICVIVYGVRLRIHMFPRHSFRSLPFLQLKYLCSTVLAIKSDRKHRASIDSLRFFVSWQVLKITGLSLDINMDHFIEWEFEPNPKAAESKIQPRITAVVILLLAAVISCNY